MLISLIYHEPITAGDFQDKLLTEQIPVIESNMIFSNKIKKHADKLHRKLSRIKNSHTARIALASIYSDSVASIFTTMTN